MTLVVTLTVVYSLSIIAFFVTGRYRVPLLPFFAIGAAVTLVGVFERLRRRAIPSAAIMIVASAVTVAVISPDHLNIRQSTAGFAGLTRAQDLLDVGDLDGGIAGL